MKVYKIHKEGYKIIAILSLLLVFINFILLDWLGEPSWLQLLINAISIGMFAFTIAFFRLPLINIEVDSDKIYAPADGRIVAIEVVQEKEYFQDQRLMVSIFMSPGNVHVNRNPISGEVQYTKYHPGNYLVAWHPKSSEKNERFTSVIKHDESEFEILVRQIAGKVARKITNYLDEGQSVIQGKELGFIKFGSRVDIYLPVDTNLKIKLKDRVKSGKSVIADLN